MMLPGSGVEVVRDSALGHQAFSAGMMDNEEQVLNVGSHEAGARRAGRALAASRWWCLGGACDSVFNPDVRKKLTFSPEV